MTKPTLIFFGYDNEERFSLAARAHERRWWPPEPEAAPVSEKRVGLNRSPGPAYGD
jgi:hypothetical protein